MICCDQLSVPACIFFRSARRQSGRIGALYTPPSVLLTHQFSAGAASAARRLRQRRRQCEYAAASQRRDRAMCAWFSPPVLRDGVSWRNTAPTVHKDAIRLWLREPPDAPILRFAYARGFCASGPMQINLGCKVGTWQRERTEHAQDTFLFSGGIADADCRPGRRAIAGARRLFSRDCGDRSAALR